MGTKSYFVLFPAELWYMLPFLLTQFIGCFVCLFRGFFGCNFFPYEVSIFSPWMKLEWSCDTPACSTERKKKSLTNAKSTSIYTNWTLLWLQDKEQKKSYFLKSIVLIEHHHYWVVLQQLKLHKAVWSQIKEYNRHLKYWPNKHVILIAAGLYYFK